MDDNRQHQETARREAQLLRLPVRALLAAVAVLTGCAGGQSGSESPIGGVPGTADDGEFVFDSQCEVRAREAIGLDDVTPMGFTPREALNLAIGTRRSSFTFEAGLAGPSTATEFSSTVEYRDGDVAWVDIEPTSGNGSCPDYVEIVVAVGVSTDDGAFDESAGTRLIAFQAQESSYVIGFDADMLTGSFDYDRYDNTAYDRRIVRFNARFDDAGTRGLVTGTGEADNAGGQTTRTQINIGSWEPGA